MPLQIDIGNVIVNVMTKHSALLGMLTQSVLNQLSSHEQPWMPSIVNQCDIGENFEIVNGSSIPQNL